MPIPCLLLLDLLYTFIKSPNQKDPIHLEGEIDREVKGMIRVKTFSNELRIFHTMQELAALDDKVNQFIADHGIKDVVSVSDCATTDNSGMTIGLIRTLTYRE
jgi:hypothetical protein